MTCIGIVTGLTSHYCIVLFCCSYCPPDRTSFSTMLRSSPRLSEPLTGDLNTEELGGSLFSPWYVAQPLTIRDKRMVISSNDDDVGIPSKDHKTFISSIDCSNDFKVHCTLEKKKKKILLMLPSYYLSI